MFGSEAEWKTSASSVSGDGTGRLGGGCCEIVDEQYTNLTLVTARVQRIFKIHSNDQWVS